MRFLIILALPLASCGDPPIQCDVEGNIVINPKASDKTQAEWTSRNLQLSLRRLDDVTGMHPVPDDRRGTLAKAEGCP